MIFEAAKHVSINAANPGGPYTLRCHRCRWERKVGSVTTAVLVRLIHVGTRKHAARHWDGNPR